MTYGDLRWHQVRFKASHNSYERDEDLHQQLLWDVGAPWQGGCRALELDIWRHSDASGGTSLGYFTVAHSSPGDVPLANYLGHLLSFHANWLNHDPVLVTLDIKCSHGSAAVFPAEIDRYLGEWFDRSLVYKPADLRARAPLPSLADVVGRAGWPRVKELCGRFIFCLSGTEDWKRTYAIGTAASSLCFADFDVDDDREVDQFGNALPANRVFANLHLYSANYATWSVSVPHLRRSGYIVRGYVLNSAAIWSKAMTAGVNVIATDEVRGGVWASVGSEPFVAI